MNKQRYWTYFIQKISKEKEGSLIKIDPWWRHNLGGAAYGTIRNYLRVLDNIGYLEKAERGWMRVVTQVPENLIVRNVNFSLVV